MHCAIHLLTVTTAISYARGFVLPIAACKTAAATTNGGGFVCGTNRARVSQQKQQPVASGLRWRSSTLASSALKMDGLVVGSDAPAFTVKDQDGTDVTLGSFKGDKNVVVYFYPKDNTSGCTKEACKFRDLKSEYEALDCIVLGVSADDETSHLKFIEDFNLNFSLLADTNRDLINAYGATKAEDKIQRSTVLIDKEGKVAAVWNPVTGAEQHPDDVLEKLKEISSA